MRRDRRRLVQIGLAAALVLAAAGIYGAVRLKRYVDTDPGLCAQCHKASPEFALWNQGSHRTISCQRCHHATPQDGLAMLRSFLAGKPAGGTKRHAQVEVGACATCHLSHDPKWPQIEGSRGHRMHVAEQKIECVRCHANAMHGFEPPTTACKECHGAHMVRAQGMQQLHCFTCHNFLSTDPGLRPTRRDCLTCHRAQGVHPARFADGAPMQFACGDCHHPHASSAATMRTDCKDCHGAIAQGGLHRVAAHQRCTDCHPPHLWRSENGKACLSCHTGAPAHAHGKACAGCHSFAGGGTPRPAQERVGTPAAVPKTPAPAAGRATETRP